MKNKILTSSKNKIPLCLINKKYISINELETHYRYGNLKDIAYIFDYIKTFDNSTDILSYETRDNIFYLLDGCIYNGNFLITIIFKDQDNNLICWINEEYLNNNASHKTILNKFAKFYGITKRKNIQTVSDEEIKIFAQEWIPTISDYDEVEQLKMSKNFLNYKKWKTLVI